MTVTAVWAVQGGSGVTTISATLGLLAAAHRRHGALLVDLAGDLPTLFGRAGDTGPGIVEWLRARDRHIDLGIYPGRVIEPVPGLAIAPRGRGPLAVVNAGLLSRQLAVDTRDVIVDAGTGPEATAAMVAMEATRSVVVTRACPLAVERLARHPIRITDVIVITEPYRRTTLTDISQAADAPVTTTVPWDPDIAVAADYQRFGLGLDAIPVSLRGALTGF